MRTHLFHATLLATAACHAPGPAPAPAMDLPVAPSVAAPADDSSVTAPANEPSVATPAGDTTVAAREPSPAGPPTLEWAVSVLPALAGHTEVDASEAAMARFLGWFGAGGAGRVHVLLDDRCHTIRGSAAKDGFYGGWQRHVRVDGDERTITEMSFEIHRGGIADSGPGGTIHRRDARGRWQQVGTFATGRFHTFVARPMSAADDRQVTFAGFWYRLEPTCDTYEVDRQTCTDGGRRRCERCTNLGLVQHRHGFGRSTMRPTMRIFHPEGTVADCSQPCPADEWSSYLPRLAAALAGREFFGVDPAVDPVVFRRAQDCARERRRRAAARPSHTHKTVGSRAREIRTHGLTGGPGQPQGGAPPRKS